MGTPLRRWRFGTVALLVLGLALTFGLSAAMGRTDKKAETGMQALILGSSVSGGAASEEATNAVGNGFTVTVVDDATWGAMTATQFSDYQLIIIGDPTCSALPAVVSQNAAALADAVMARVGSNTKAGNRVLIGTDPRFHSGQGGAKLIETAIDFAGVQEGASGLYLTFSCFDPDYDGNGIPDGQDKLLPLLTIDAGGTWAQNQTPPCGGDVSLISNAAQFSTLTSTDLRGWNCSVHETFPQFPTDWTALAIATDTPTAPTCGNDVDTGAAVCGEAYVLIAGSGIVVVAPNLSLTPATASNPVGTQHTVTATVTNPDNTPRPGVLVDFVVTGANAGATGTCVPADCMTDANGQVTFTYTGTVVGDDTINAAITVDGSRQTATASKTWTAAPTNQCGTSPNPPCIIEIRPRSMFLTEADGCVGLTINILQGKVSDGTVGVRWLTVAGTAKTPQDYDNAGATVTFPSGSNAVPVIVCINDDAVTEPRESFTAQLVNPVNAVIEAPGQKSTIYINSNTN